MIWLRLLVLLVIAVAAAYLVYALSRRGSRMALDAYDVEVVDAVYERAWADRDVQPELAEALIERIREARKLGVRPSLVDELREIAWSHRESDPQLSVVVLDMIGRNGPPALP